MLHSILLPVATTIAQLCTSKRINDLMLEVAKEFGVCSAWHAHQRVEHEIQIRWLLIPKQRRARLAFLEREEEQSFLTNSCIVPARKIVSVHSAPVSSAAVSTSPGVDADREPGEE